MMVGVLYLPQAQTIDVAGFSMFSDRFLELAGFIRVMARHEFSFRALNKVDKALLWLYLFVPIIFGIRGDPGLAFTIGGSVDAFLCYFAFRGLVRDLDDLRWFLRAFVFLLAPYALLVVFESLTAHNLFALLGGTEGGGHWMRNGRPRCFGSFRQPTTLGMFAATFIPMFIGMACITKERNRALLGIGFCLVIVWASNAGGPISAAAAGLACWGFWRYRTKMRKVRWGIVATLTALALVMKAPIWYIFARASAITGGDGWDRSYIIDVAYRHLHLWWLAGMNMLDTADWNPAGALVSTGASDITNQYISFGLNAGLGAIVLFILVLTRAYSQLGQALASVRSNKQTTNDQEFLLWGLGVMLLVHIVDWFGITYFDQMYMVWFMHLAVISTLSQAYLARPATATEAVTDLEMEIEAPRPNVGLGQSNGSESFSS
jgi:hypothetical protein